MTDDMAFASTIALTELGAWYTVAALLCVPCAELYRVRRVA